MAVQVITLVTWGTALATLGSTAKDIKDLVDQSGADFGLAELAVGATETEISIVWKGTEFNLNHEAQLRGKTSVEETDAQGNVTAKRVWEWAMNVIEDAGHTIDGLTIDGWVKHMWQPHAIDEKQLEALPFKMIVNADNTEREPTPGSNDTFTIDINGGDLLKKVTHPADEAPMPEALTPEPHIDQITKEKFSATINDGVTGPDFTGYSFELTVQHKESD